MLRTFSVNKQADGGDEVGEVTVRELNSVNSERNDGEVVVSVEDDVGRDNVVVVDVDVCENVRESSL